MLIIGLLLPVAFTGQCILYIIVAVLLYPSELYMMTE